MTGGSIREIAIRLGVCALTFVALAGNASPATGESPGGPASGLPASRGLFKGPLRFGTSYAQRKQVIADLPLQRLTAEAKQRIVAIADSPTIYRRLPTQAIDCDRDMFLCLTRNPELLVGFWDLMGITKVTTRRTGPYQLEAVDGSGTTCRVDLVYGDANVHVFVADGSYDGPMVAKPIRGSAVFVLNSKYAKSASGGTTVTGSLDCFIQLDNLGADLVARTLSGLIGRSADNNFVETARFIGQISQAAQRNPAALVEVAGRLPQVSEPTQRHFADVITTVARRAEARPRIVRQDPVDVPEFQAADFTPADRR